MQKLTIRGHGLWRALVETQAHLPTGVAEAVPPPEPEPDPDVNPLEE